MTVEGLIAHLIGDYLIQSEWMAAEKTKRWTPAVVHGLVYTIPFLILTQSPWALIVIAGTHMVIDRYRLARHLVWLKNWLAPHGWNLPWAKCQATGYGPDKEPGFAVALLIVADNTMHLVINAAALTWLA
ncbi:DUF3307 domain-containing protein [Glycomyces sp. A-F 0318]|uniref:DUF3307 domain-containing protein n=1 Tax=Glycomyces amatae TaxID=2881355 RepID=UPI001E28D5A8|nr:DUF3307 domain-containing protein [Glycomyces amatae]MCD0445846.1 DUF3307 domain-containing protein [Glycomyces amatae]